MQNPWKLTTLALAGALLISNARAESDWKKDAISHLEKAATLLEQHGGSTTGKTPKTPSKSEREVTPTSKALQLTRAAIVQMKRINAE
jgi:hypothetical protein